MDEASIITYVGETYPDATNPSDATFESVDETAAREAHERIARARRTTAGSRANS